MSKTNGDWIKALNDIADGVVAFDTNWCYTYINKRASEIVNRKPQDLIGKHIWTEFPEGINQPFYHLYHKAMKTQKPYRIEDYYEPFDMWFESRAYPHSEGLIVFFNDITEAKKNQQLILQSKNEIETIINNIGDPIFVKDEHSRILIVNNAFCRVFDMPRDTIIGKTLAEKVPPNEQEEFLKIDKEVLATGKENINEETLTVEGHDTRYILTKKTRFIDNNGKVFLIGILRDITERKKIEIQLEESKQYLNNVINNVGDPLFVKDSKSRFLLANQAFYKLFNRTEDEIIGRAFADDVTQQERKQYLKVDQEVFSTGNEVIIEDSFVNKNGETQVISTKKTSFVDKKGNQYLLGVIRDITKLKKAESDLKQSKDFTDKLIMSMQEGLIIVNLDGKIIMVNDSACSTLGYSKEEFIGMELPYPFAKIENFEKIHQTLANVTKGKSPNFEFEFIKKNGEQFLASFLSGNIKDDEGNVIALFVTMKDISKEHKNKIRLKENAKISNLRKKAILKLTDLVGQDFKSL